MKVVFLGGAPRSGSTLLDRLLGELPGFVSLGEVRRVWKRGVVANGACSCGEPFGECDFWRGIVARAFGKEAVQVAKRAVALGARLERQRRAYGLAHPRLFGRISRDGLAEYREYLSRLLTAVVETTGASVLVDSSKDPLYGLVLSEGCGIDLRAVHLVRDSRAVAFSMSRHRARAPGVNTRSLRAEMPRASSMEAALSWNLRNLNMRLLAHRAPTIVVHYRELIEDTHDSLSRIASLVDMPTSIVPRFDDSCVSLPVAHIVSGNPMRFTTGTVTLRPDVDWLTSMPSTDRRIVTALTWPLLRGLPLDDEAAAPLASRETGS